MPNILDYYIKGQNRAQLDLENKASNNLSVIRALGTAPTPSDALQLKDVLGINWPKNAAGAYRPVPLNNTSKGGYSTDSLRAMLLGRKIQGLPLDNNQSEVLSQLNTSKKPYELGNLDPSLLSEAIKVKLGLAPDANTQTVQDNKNKQFEMVQQLRTRTQQSKEDAEARLNEDRDAKRISDDQYRKRRLDILSKHKAFTGDMILKIMNGEELPAIDFEKLYDINFDGEANQGFGSDSMIQDIVMNAKDMEGPKRLEYVRNELKKIAAQIAGQL